MPDQNEINLLQYKAKLRVENKNDRRKIFDPIRKRWYVFLPEEFVRQLALIYLTDALNYPLKRIGVERQLEVDKLRKRFDIVVFDDKAVPLILVECKSPQHRISDSVAYQIAHYNRTLRADYLWLTNGESNLFFKMDYDLKNAVPIDQLPKY